MLTTIGTVLGFVIVTLVRDWRDGKSIKNDSNLAKRMDGLVLHFNHETTDTLNKIVDKLDDILVNGVRMRK